MFDDVQRVIISKIKDVSVKVMESDEVLTSVVNKNSKNNLQHKAAVKNPIYNDNCDNIAISEDGDFTVEEDASTEKTNKGKPKKIIVTGIPNVIQFLN